MTTRAASVVDCRQRGQALPILVAGAAIEAHDTVPVVSPATGQVVSIVGQASPADVEQALESARQTFDRSPPPPAHTRRAVLESIATELESLHGPMARIIAEEAGKPITLARAEVSRAVDVLRLTSATLTHWGRDARPADITPAGTGFTALIDRVPLGPVLAIGPFNFPLNLLVHKVAPALGVGAPVIVKPPPQAPTAALLLGALATDALEKHRAPPLVSVLPCANARAESLVADERIGVLSFTGSDAVGWRLRKQTPAPQVVLELGGDAAVIVCADADLDAAARRIAWGACVYAGQVCISVQRIFVEAPIHKIFARKLAQAFAAVPVGDPFDPATLCGPVIDARAAERIVAVIDEATRTGSVLCRRPGWNGGMPGPTLVDRPDLGTALGSDEVFGPVAGLWPFERFDDALDQVNTSRFGLQAGLWTRDLGRVFEAHRRLRVGAVVVNDVPTLRLDHLPYGGTKRSGMGREGPESALDAYTEPRVLLLNPGSPA